MKRKGFNDTPHFGSLPQGERKENRKDFNSTLTLALSRWWRGLMKRKEFNGSLTFVLSCIWEVDLGLKVYLDDVGWGWG
jgi:hypothetical protein